VSDTTLLAIQIILLSCRVIVLCAESRLLCIGVRAIGKIAIAIHVLHKWLSGVVIPGFVWFVVCICRLLVTS
jgi:hypothetical protein